MGVVKTILSIYIFILFIRALLSWLPPSAADSGVVGQFNHLIIRITEPVLKPVRRAIPALRVGTVGLDLSVLLVIVALSVLVKVL